MHVLLKMHQNDWLNFPRGPISALRRIWRLSLDWTMWIYFLSFGCAGVSVRLQRLPGKWTDHIPPRFYRLLIRFPGISHTFCLSPSFALSRWHIPAARRLEMGPVSSPQAHRYAAAALCFLACSGIVCKHVTVSLGHCCLQRWLEPVRVTLFSHVPHR